MGYEGWVVMEPDRDVRARKAAEAIGRLVARVERLEMAGFPIEIVSAGGTNTHDMTGAHPRVTELQAGSYALMDAAYAPLSPVLPAGADHARHGHQPPRNNCRTRLRHQSGCRST